MKAMIEEMVLWIRDGGMSYKEAVEYAEQTINGIVASTVNRIENADIRPARDGENGDALCSVTGVPQRGILTGDIPRVESPFENKEKIGED